MCQVRNCFSWSQGIFSCFLLLGVPGVLSLTFRSFIRFVFIFVYGVRKWSSLILLHMTVHFYKHHLLNRLSFFALDTLPCFAKDYLAAHLWVRFRGLYSILLVYVSVFVPIPYSPDDYSFVEETKVWECDASLFGFLPKYYYFDYWGSLWFHTNFRIVCSTFEKNSGATGIALNV